MQLVDKLRSKNIKVTVSPKWGCYFRKHWEDKFACNLSKHEREEIYMVNIDGFCGYLWHIFSYGKIKHYSREEANKLFDNIDKKFCYIFYQHEDDVLIIENANNFCADDLVNEMDIYVVNKDFSWTYVRTHERDFGPYFVSINRTKE